MNKFPMLKVLLQLFIALTIGLIEKIFVFLYCLLPIGLFMVLMSFRTKNHKTTALTAFTNEHSEFQHIFPNFILVTVEPNFIKRQIQKKIQHINSFIQKYFLMFLVLLFLAVIIIAITYYLMHFIF